MSSALCSVLTPAMVYVPCTTLATSVCLVRLLPCFWIPASYDDTHVRRWSNSVWNVHRVLC